MDVLSAVALGGFLGLIVGLSISGVVGTVVAGLVATVATFLGLHGGLARLPPATPRRVLSFSIAAALAILIGIGLRTHDLLSPNLQSRLKSWENVGFDGQTARELVAFERLGIVRYQDSFVQVDNQPQATNTVLFNISSNASFCQDYLGMGITSADPLRAAMIAADGIWKKLAEKIGEDVPPDTAFAIMTTAITWFCELSS
jgi:hypothetical protein